ncbi:Transposon Ty2-C Gag-Pol polyprotein [Durusdinium trenchii]|uniref:Transposon Ty2-C Gag-Pol polyprotein n=1 Tax=Durusdinium trenchii TaxID=1381693 RepID=A0ABP0R0F3_9DINO
MSFIKPIPVFIGPAAFFHAHFGNRDKVPSTGSDVVEVVPCVILPGLTMVSAEKCRDAFFEPANFEILSSVSGGSTIAKIDYWEHTSEMDIHAAYVLNMSELSASYCWSQGFKYWELALNRNLYFDSWIHELGTSVECEGCAELRKRVEELAIKVFIGLCVPEICSETEIREEVSPGYLMNVLNSPIPFPVPGEPQLDVTELSHWSQFQLDLIIAGLDNCGTTSLGRWLQQALRHPNLWAHLRVRMALARIPQLKVLLVVCPAARGTLEATLPTPAACGASSVYARIRLGHLCTDCRLDRRFRGFGRGSPRATQSSARASN